MPQGLPAQVLVVGAVLWAACLVPAVTRGVIVVGTTTFPSGKRSEKCARQLAEKNQNSPGRAMSRCLNASTTVLVPAATKEGIVFGTTMLPYGKLTEKCVRVVVNSNPRSPFKALKRCMSASTTVLVPAATKEVIVFGTTMLPYGKLTEKCVRVVVNSNSRSPFKALKRCMSASTTVLAKSSSVIVGTVPVPDDALTKKCMAQLDNVNTSMPGSYVVECRKTTTTVVPGTPSVDTEGATFISKHVNDDAVLSCVVRDKGDHKVTWMSVSPRSIPLFIDTQRVHPDRRYKLESDGNTTFNMRIQRIRKEDDGIYACQVNTMKPMSVNFTLQVVVAPTINGVLAQSGAVPEIDNYRFSYNESDDVILTCDADGSPKPQIAWKLPSGEFASRNGTLRIPNIQREQGGLFLCTADNGYPEKAEEQWVQVIVQYKPDVIADERDMRRGEGDYLQLVCRVQARPPAEYTWIKGDRLLNGIDKNYQTKLVIMSVNPETDYGVYRCQATNLLGTTEDQIEISGRLRAPKIVSDPVGVRRHSYKLQWVMGNRFQQGTAGYTPIDGYTLSYYGWWFQETETGEIEKVYSNSPDSPLEVDTAHDPGLPRQLYILRDLRANLTYEVMLKGYNKYGDGDNTTFTFYTALVNSWETTTVPSKRTTARKGSAKKVWRSAGTSLRGTCREAVILTLAVWILNYLL